MNDCGCIQELKGAGYWEYTICAYHVNKIKEMNLGN